ncbi:ABC transporter permease [Cellulomonas timonensis]|uniref:ABC transporter permease n=1 Tax=Cellulomonas timonensis TaxID=1689271 RepID=UPI00082ADFEA|nr:ABC transporter permease [Cellulomonas timonensis]
MSATATSPQVLGRLTMTEARLFARQPSAWFFSLLFPVVLLLALGLLMPWADQPFDDRDPVLSQINGITGYTPTVLALAIGTVAYSTLPAVVVAYREKGVLRRLATTPLPASRLLTAQLLVLGATLIAAAALAVGAGVAVLDVSLPADPLVVLLAFVLAAAASLAVGCLIAARVGSVGGATGIGMTVYFVSLFFAGVWMPLPLMPEVVQTISEWTPLGAASQALAAGWYGQAFPALELAVMAGWTVLLVPLAAKLFRWT